MANKRATRITVRYTLPHTTDSRDRRELQQDLELYATSVEKRNPKLRPEAQGQSARGVEQKPAVIG